MLDAKHSNFDKLEGVKIAYKNFGPKLAPIYLSILMTLYLVHLNCKGSTVQAWQGIHTKVSCFHISSHLKKECKQVLVKKFFE